MVVDRAETVKSSGDVKTFKWLFFEATVDTDDTVTFASLTAITGGYILKKSDCATAVTFTKATNVATITQAALDEEVVQGIMWGTPA